MANTEYIQHWTHSLRSLYSVPCVYDSRYCVLHALCTRGDLAADYTPAHALFIEEMLTNLEASVEEMGRSTPFSVDWDLALYTLRDSLAEDTRDDGDGTELMVASGSYRGSSGEWTTSCEIGRKSMGAAIVPPARRQLRAEVGS